MVDGVDCNMQVVPTSITYMLIVNHVSDVSVIRQSSA